MFKSYWVVAMTYLLIIVLSSEADAQPTVDESALSCSSGTFPLEEVAKVIRKECEDVKKTACVSNQQQQQVSCTAVDASSLCEYKTYFI